MDDIGKYEIVRIGWKCNLCGKMSYVDEKRLTHRCNNAPHFVATETIAQIPKNKLKEVLDLIN